MAEDMIERLKAKEEEMEALLTGARKKALSIREEAHRNAKEIKNAKLMELEREIKDIEAGADASVKDEIRKIEESGKTLVEGIRKKGSANSEAALEEAARRLRPSTEVRK